MKVELRDAVGLAFSSFCVGAIIAHFLTIYNFHYLSLWMGLPAYVATVIIRRLLKHPTRKDQP